MKTLNTSALKRELKIAPDFSETQSKPKICLFIKNEILRAGASCYLKRQGYDIYETSGSVNEIADAARENNFAAIISDQPRETLIEIGQGLSNLPNFTSVIAIDMAPDEHLLNANVRVFLSNPFSPEILLLGVQSALESSYFFPLNKNTNSNGESILVAQAQDTAQCQISGLSERELQVLRKLASGMSNKELSAELFVTEDTVKSHLHNLLRKLKVRNRTELVAKFLQSNL